MTSNIRLLSEGFEQAARNLGGDIESGIFRATPLVEQLQTLAVMFEHSSERFQKSIDKLAVISGMNASNEWAKHVGHSPIFMQEDFDKLALELQS